MIRNNKKPQGFPLHLPDADITYYPNFISHTEASAIFETLKEETPWQQDDIKVFGKVYAQPRLTALYGTNQKSYKYSNIEMIPHPLTTTLANLKQLVDETCHADFTTLLLNYYRDGKDSNGWHADNEKELGNNPIIASLSFGQERFFHLKHRTDKTLKHKLLLQHGSLLLMKGETQHRWLHQIPKTAKEIQGRINITFRIIA
ncbi:alpha-ketoglutarate-dependent dioxygenase AlkB [Kordia sp. YSTF-M3]|uniref:Alpha-ketoglutarate-dependent dioxygenase AlkB n=1 Tax=Kordia aestuariivivens TaxID=2759037 RepID=A0ABR7QGS1_9FLAO|nr:alpha-ketoglutarate-dependent dioxygenase AlkB [Kordia aestuariivivens]MBC8757519.1 alpha-ketoglutarate-dependent dioxygenase AlkB [Kordia aestuariivivens]